MVRMSLTVTPSLSSDVGYIASRIGITKSALIGQLLNESVADLRQLLEAVPERPDKGDVLRFRGQSEALVSERMDSLRRLDNDLFSD